MGGAVQKAQIKAFLNPDGLTIRQLDDFGLPDQLRVENLVKAHYGLGTLDTNNFVEAVINKPPVSVMQVMQHVEKHADADKALAAWDEMYVWPEKPEQPEPEPPKGWIVDFLSDDDALKDYAPNFLDQKITTKEDLLAEPPLDCTVLKEVLGIQNS